MTNGGTKFLTAQYEYNELGQLMEKNLHATDVNETQFLQSVDFTYNIRGWLQMINNRLLNDGEGDLYGQEMYYEQGFMALNAPAQYNGNIAAIRWRAESTGASGRAYAYQYDPLNQLTHARYAFWQNSDWDAENRYTADYSYDLNGNLQTLQRHGKTSAASETYGLLDDLTYYYYGNTLKAVDDNIITNHGYDFSDNGSNSNSGQNTEYQHDDNGNMIEDENKGIEVNYNHLNLPTHVDFTNGGNIEWLYSAAGEKLRKVVYNNGEIVTTLDYVGSFVYEDGELSFFSTDEGRVVHENNTFRYDYFLTDHLGNTRVVFSDLDNDNDADLVQQDHYYPFGMRLAGLSTTGDVENKYLYNGKELEDEFGLNWYHYGFRYYDPQLGRWHVVDPLAVKNSDYTPYHYTRNSPIARVDLLGLDDYYYQDKDNYTVNDRSWLWDLFVGDRFYAQHDQGDVTYGERNYFQANSRQTVAKFDWTDIDLDFRTGEFVTRFEDAIPKSDDQRSSFTYAYKESVERKMDQKLELNKNRLYLFSGIVYNRNEAGNIVWGAVMNHLGFSLDFSRLAGHFGAIKVKGRLDERFDQRALTVGHRYFNFMGKPRR